MTPDELDAIEASLDQRDPLDFKSSKLAAALRTAWAERDWALARVKYMDRCLLDESNAKDARPSPETVAKVREALTDIAFGQKSFGDHTRLSKEALRLLEKL